jgi:hypothetical protein
MKFIFTFACIVFIPLFLLSCKQYRTGQEVQTAPIPVRATPPVHGSIEDYIDLNGKTIYLKKNRIVAPISAYVSKVHVQYGDIVRKGAVLFELQTKESKALSDSTGDVKVLALSGGTVIEQIINQAGAYLVEGDLLCTIVENRDLMIQVNVPYQYNSLLKTGTHCRILLPDETSLSSTIDRILPAISETDQTQTVFLLPENSGNLPENSGNLPGNLNLTVRFILNTHSCSLLVPRGALMTNEKQDDFWLMKLVHDSLAVKVPVDKGIENDSLVEILSPDLNMNDLVITEGAYGLEDSSIVRMIK